MKRTGTFLALCAFLTLLPSAAFSAKEKEDNAYYLGTKGVDYIITADPARCTSAQAYVILELLIPVKELTVRDGGYNVIGGFMLEVPVSRGEVRKVLSRSSFTLPHLLPADAEYKEGRLPIRAFEGLLYPGEYWASAEVVDVNNKNGRERPFKFHAVMAVSDPREFVRAWKGSGGDAKLAPAPGAPIQKIPEDISVKEEPRVILKKLPEVSGKDARVEVGAYVSGDASRIAWMEFWVNGRMVAKRKGSPWAYPVDLKGTERYEIRVMAYDAEGVFIDGDAAFVNGFGSEPEVRIISPVDGSRPGAKAKVKVVVLGGSVPPTRVDFFANEALIGTDAESPYEAIVELPVGVISELRVVAMFEDGIQAVDSIVMNLPAGEFGEKLEVVYVNLSVSVLEREDGKEEFVRGLPKESFEVRENDVKQDILSFEYADHGEPFTTDADAFAERLDIAKQIFRGRGSDDRNILGALFVIGIEQSSKV